MRAIIAGIWFLLFLSAMTMLIFASAWIVTKAGT